MKNADEEEEAKEETTPLSLILSEGKVNNYKSVSLYIDSPERRNQIISSENFYDGN